MSIMDWPSRGRPWGSSACRSGLTSAITIRRHPMALMPKRVKHRKEQRGRVKGDATRGTTVAFGDWGLQSVDAGHVRGTTIEACRVAATQYVRGEGKLYIRIFPTKPM